MSAPLDDSLDALRDRLSKLGVDVDVDSSTLALGVSGVVSSGGVAAASEVCFSLFILSLYMRSTTCVSQVFCSWVGLGWLETFCFKGEMITHI